jgi:hypothetical protein
VHIFRHLFVCFQTSVYTLGEFHQNRNNYCIWRIGGVNCGFDGRKYLFYWLRFALPVQWHLQPSNPQLTPPTLQIQYCYSLKAGLRWEWLCNRGAYWNSWQCWPRLIWYKRRVAFSGSGLSSRRSLLEIMTILVLCIVLQFYNYAICISS